MGGHRGWILRAEAVLLKVPLRLPIDPIGEIGPFPPTAQAQPHDYLGQNLGSGEDNIHFMD